MPYYASSNCNTISGGNYNQICAITGIAISNNIAGGYRNRILSNSGKGTNTIYNSILGGHCNLIQNSQCSSVTGGFYSRIADANFATAFGCGNYINNSSHVGILSGRFNQINSNSNYSSIIGGYNNVITGCTNAHIIGGAYITAYASNSTFVRNLYVGGNLTKGSGTFKISHPDPRKNKDCSLFHSFVESPTAGDNIYRFEVVVKDGVAEIELPDYYKYLNENTQVWITPKDGFGIAYGNINEEMTKIIVKANLDIEYNVLVIGTRKDITAKTHWKGVERVKTEAEKKNNNIKK